MSKIIVVKDCNNCPKASISLANSNKFCHSDFDKLCPRIGIPDWCPLRPLPERKDNADMVGFTPGKPITKELADKLVNFGFNICLDEITDVSTR